MGRFIGMMTPPVSRRICFRAFIFQANSASDAAKMAGADDILSDLLEDAALQRDLQLFVALSKPSAAKNMGVRNSP